jgi:hypothetical protein
MKKFTIDCLVGDEVYFNWVNKYVEGTIKEINQDWFILDIKPEFVDNVSIGSEMGIAIQIVKDEISIQ